MIKPFFSFPLTEALRNIDDDEENLVYASEDADTGDVVDNYADAEVQLIDDEEKDRVDAKPESTRPAGASHRESNKMMQQAEMSRLGQEIRERAREIGKVHQETWGENPECQRLLGELDDALADDTAQAIIRKLEELGIAASAAGVDIGSAPGMPEEPVSISMLSKLFYLTAEYDALNKALDYGTLPVADEETLGTLGRGINWNILGIGKRDTPKMPTTPLYKTIKKNISRADSTRTRFSTSKEGVTKTREGSQKSSISVRRVDGPGNSSYINFTPTVLFDEVVRVMSKDTAGMKALRMNAKTEDLAVEYLYLGQAEFRNRYAATVTMPFGMNNKTKAFGLWVPGKTTMSVAARDILVTYELNPAVMGKGRVYDKTGQVVPVERLKTIIDQFNNAPMASQGVVSITGKDAVELITGHYSFKTNARAKYGVKPLFEFFETVSEASNISSDVTASAPGGSKDEGPGDRNITDGVKANADVDTGDTAMAVADVQVKRRLSASKKDIDKACGIMGIPSIDADASEDERLRGITRFLVSLSRLMRQSGSRSTVGSIDGRLPIIKVNPNEGASLESAWQHVTRMADARGRLAPQMKDIITKDIPVWAIIRDFITWAETFDNSVSAQTVENLKWELVTDERFDEAKEMLDPIVYIQGIVEQCFNGDLDINSDEVFRFMVKYFNVNNRKAGLDILNPTGAGLVPIIEFVYSKYRDEESMMRSASEYHPASDDEQYPAGVAKFLLSGMSGKDSAELVFPGLDEPVTVEDMKPNEIVSWIQGVYGRKGPREDVVQLLIDLLMTGIMARSRDTLHNRKDFVHDDDESLFDRTVSARALLSDVVGEYGKDAVFGLIGMIAGDGGESIRVLDQILSASEPLMEDDPLLDELPSAIEKLKGLGFLTFNVA